MPCGLKVLKISQILEFDNILLLVLKCLHYDNLQLRNSGNESIYPQMLFYFHINTSW